MDVEKLGAELGIVLVHEVNSVLNRAGTHEVDVRTLIGTQGLVGALEGIGAPRRLIDDRGGDVLRGGGIGGLDVLIRQLLVLVLQGTEVLVTILEVFILGDNPGAARGAGRSRSGRAVGRAGRGAGRTAVRVSGGSRPVGKRTDILGASGQGKSGKANTAQKDIASAGGLIEERHRGLLM